MAKRRAFLLARLGPLLLLASCLSGTPQPAAMLAPTAEIGALTYWCGDGGSLSVEKLAGRVRVTGGDADSVELPATPPGQEKRYSRQPYALNLDDRDVLFVKTGNPPLACTR